MNKGKILSPFIAIWLFGVLILYYIKITTPVTHDITGMIDGCCCEAEILRTTNLEIESDIDALSHTLFFKLFRVNLDSDCPFWAQQLLCTEKSKCIVSRSDDSEIPPLWLQKTDPISLGNSDISSVVDENSVPSSDEWFFEEQENSVYVNLKVNQEAWTGYQGQKIWEVIYGENCFKHEEMCMEEHVFNNLISGLHTSISSHLSEFYFEEGRTESKPNFRLYFQKVGDFPERIKNLYFLYSVLLRAINVGANIMRDFKIETGDFKNDIKSKELLGNVLDKIGKYCDFPINEKEFFNDVSKKEIRRQFQAYFYNISRIMDCVECEKCKVYGKMQIAGVGTALKLLFSERENGTLPTLRRNELIALINTFGKVAKSVKIADQMFEKRFNAKHAIFMTIFACGIVMIVFFYTVMRAWEDMDGKLKKKFRTAASIERQHLKTN